MPHAKLLNAKCLCSTLFDRGFADLHFRTRFATELHRHVNEYPGFKWTILLVLRPRSLLTQPLPSVTVGGLHRILHVSVGVNLEVLLAFEVDALSGRWLDASLRPIDVPADDEVSV